MERWKTELLPLLPRAVQNVLKQIPEEECLLEIRLRAEQPMQLVFATGDRSVYAAGGRPMLTQDACVNLLSAFCEQSVYAWEQELSDGFLTIRGGFRVGIAGRAIRQENGLVRYTNVNGFCIRIIREVKNAARPLVPFLTEHGRVQSILLISPPNFGKTTVLRDLIRIVSNGLYGVPPMRVCVADERFELCGSFDGSCAFDLGIRTDVVSGLKKAEALERMLAALSPQVLATDELRTERDAEAIHRARACGVQVFATAHADAPDNLWKRSAMQRLKTDAIFDRIILLGDAPIGAIRQIYDGTGRLLRLVEESA